MKNLSSLFAFLSFGLISLSSLAASADEISIQEFERIRAECELEFADLPGRTYSALAACDPETGLGLHFSSHEEGEVCLLFGLETQADLDEVQALYDLPVRREGLLVGFKVTGRIGPIRPQ